jgi:5'-AMP-activated protein kinase catalytic alpha subunit
MIAGKRYNGLMSDLWSVGVVLYAMLCGYLPFEDQKTSDLYKKILSADYTLPDFLSPEAEDMIKQIF